MVLTPATAGWLLVGRARGLSVKRGDDVAFTKPLFGGSFRTARGAGAVWCFEVREVKRRTSASYCGPAATRGRDRPRPRVPESR
jgi:hypothetical protein